MGQFQQLLSGLCQAAAMFRRLAIAAALLAAPACAEPLQGDQAALFLALHNAARDDAKLPRLSWSDDLAKAADPWAKKLARDGKLKHSEWKDREGTGENLWIGTAGYFTPREMIGAFIGEKQYFRPGTFPEVSTTGSWQDVGHYTQIIWPTTTQVGCAMARAKGNDVLVCRYAPAGNYFGDKVG
jgi:uncharacterized protein YkwD